MNNWKTRKITYASAKEDIIGSRDRVKTTLCELEFQHTLQNKETTEAPQAQMKCFLRCNVSRFRELPSEVHEWNKQHDNVNLGKSRDSDSSVFISPGVSMC